MSRLFHSKKKTEIKGQREKCSVGRETNRSLEQFGAHYKGNLRDIIFLV